SISINFNTHPIMKYIIYLVLIFWWLTGCGLDNYDEPSSTLSGQITYEGEPVRLRGTGEAVQLQLYQDGYELDAPIPVYVKQDGSFEAELFDGVYKLVTRDQNGPWVNSRDTTLVTLDGETQISLEVTPYFTISDVSLTLEGEAKLRGSFTIGRVSPDARVEYAMLLIAKTTFVDDVVNLERIDISDPAAGSSIQLSLDASGNENVVNSKALFARVGVRTVGADQAIYSEVVQVR